MLFHETLGHIEVLLVHPGGPFWAKKDEGSWSNTFCMEWPPKSGRQQEFPEVERAEWFTIESAMQKILKGQAGFLTQLQEKNQRNK